MYPIYNLTKRHLLRYFRDRSALFFSLLSVLIILLLMLVFLGDMNKTELINLIQNAHGTLSEADANHIIVMWTIAGMLVVNAFTVPITMIGIYIEDKEAKRLESFYTSPLSRGGLLLSYLLSALISSFLMCSLLLLFSFLYVTYTGYAFLTFLQLLQVLGLLLLSIIVSSCLVLLIAHMVKSDRAWGAFSTLAGTLIGFVGGIYLPTGMLPDLIQSILKGLPFLHESALMRDIFTSQPLEAAFANLPSAYLSGYQEAMGIIVSLQDQPISICYQILGLCLCAIITLGIAIYLLKKHSAFDR